MRMKKFALLGLLALAAAPRASAQAFPLPASAGSTAATADTAPFILPDGMKQTRVVDRNTLTAQGLPAGFGDWDMITFDPTSRWIFVPIEESMGGGAFRYDTLTGQFRVLMQGNGSGVRQSNPALFDASNDDFSRTDPCTLTPWGTILTGEETTGGRLFEILNPFAANGPYNVVWRSAIPAMSHEGVRLDASGALYTVDEDNSGSLYKFVPTNAGDLSQGQSFVLKVTAFTGDASQVWNSATNLGKTRVGNAVWVPITDAAGTPLTTANPFAYVTTTGGRNAADELGGTPYGRPEDVTFSRLANGHEVVYFTATSEHSVYGVELVSSTTAVVRLFVSRNTIDEATGAAVGTALTSPDNLETDAFGNVYVVEDNFPGDIWKCRDADKDGVAESMGRFLSLGVDGSEPTGFISNPNNPYEFIVSIQHPNSGNDAIWRIRSQAFPGTGDDLVLGSGINTAPSGTPGEFVKTGHANDLASFRVESPNGTFVGAAYYFFYDLYATGFRPVTGLPFLHCDLATSVPLVNAVPSIFPLLIPAGGADFLAPIPAGLAGISVMFQSAAVSPFAHNGFVAVSNGQEIQFIL